MNKYNKIEYFIAKGLSYSPGLKQFLKKVYVSFNFLLSKKRPAFSTNKQLIAVSTEKEESFFGYYDKSPENLDGAFVIYQRSSQNTKKKPNPLFPVEIVLKEIKTNSEHIIDQSTSYNWQQGTKLQWLTNYTFIYNFFDKNTGSYKSKIINAETKKVIKVMDHPVYDCYQNKYALSLNFNRLFNLRPDYGYRNIQTKVNPISKNDGVFFVDLKNNEIRILLSLSYLAANNPKNNMANANHKVNHIMISPNGNKFMFIHRWIIPSGKRYDRLYVCDVSGQNLKIISDSGMVSHCCWKDNDTIISFLHDSSNGNAFYCIDVINNKTELLSTKLIEFDDGHPSIYNNKMVFDSYPDRSRMKQLFIFDINKNELEKIGEFFEPIRFFGESRCDLHPKWNYKGNKLFIDSVHEGKRKLYEIVL